MTRRASNWSERKKIEAVTTYLALGKLPFVASVTTVPLETLRSWKKSEWWEDLEAQIRTEENQELDARLSKIVNKSLDVVIDRLDNGDFYLDKFGKAHRIPVKMKEASRVSAELLDKRSLIRREPTKKEQIKQETVNERLISLAEQFAAIAMGKDPTKVEKIIEGEVLDAVHDQWEKGLQEGTLLGAQEETESCEGSGCAEQSEGYDGAEIREVSNPGEGYRPQDSNISWGTLENV